MTPARVPGVRRLSALMQGAREPVFLLDARRRLIYVNRAWEELTGYESDAVAGIECLPQGPNRDGDLAGLGGSFCPPPEALAGRATGGPTLIVHASGERRWRRLEFWPLHDPKGGLAGLLGFVRAADEPPHAPDSDTQRLRAELSELRDRLRQEFGPEPLLGRGPAHRRLLDQVRAAAASDVPALVIGEPGTGKRLVARTIHALGPRAKAPILPFDCAALPPEVLDRELFGSPGGDAETAARLDLPEGASVVLVDVLELPRDLQGRLAAVDDRRVRLLATTAIEPEVARRTERLRPDLYFALTTLVIRLEPLRERLGDLPLLAQHFLERANVRGDRRRAGFDSAALEALVAYDWPGNVRELARVVDAAHARAVGDLIGVDDIPAAVRGHLGASYNPPPAPRPITPLDEALVQLERKLIEQALARARQNKSRAAELLDISRPRLYRRIKELNIPDMPETADEPGNGATVLTGGV